MNEKISKFFDFRNFILIKTIYFAFIFIFGVLLVVKATPMSGIDELYHFKRALQISQGQLFADKLNSNHYGGRLDSRLLHYEAYFDDHRNNSLPSSKTEARELAIKIDKSATSRQPDEFGSSATYSPIPYIPNAIGLLAGRVLHLGVAKTVLLGRLSGFLIWMVGLGLLMRILPAGKLSVIALLSMPAAIGVASSYSADPVTNIVCALFVAWCLRLACTPDMPFGETAKRGMFAAACILGLLKLTCALIALSVLIVPENIFRSKRNAWVFRFAIIATAFGTTAVWNGFYPFVPGLYWGSGGLPSKSIPMIVHHPFHHLNIILHNVVAQAWPWWKDAHARFANGPAPLWFGLSGTASTVGLGALVTLGMADVAKRRRYRISAVFLLLAMAYVVEVLLAFKVAFAPPDALYITGVQGRYMIVPWTLVILALSVFSPFGQRLKLAAVPALLVWMTCSATIMQRALDGYRINWH